MSKFGILCMEEHHKRKRCCKASEKYGEFAMGSLSIFGEMPQKHSPIILSPRVEGLMGANVHSFIDEERKCWKTALIDETLLSFEPMLVKSIPLCITAQLDELIWPHSATSAYTVKTGYHFL